MKNSYLLIACLLLLTHQQTRAERIDTLLHFSYADLKMDTLTASDGNTYTKLTYPGCGEGDRRGAPVLPVSYVGARSFVADPEETNITETHYSVIGESIPPDDNALMLYGKNRLPTILPFSIKDGYLTQSAYIFAKDATLGNGTGTQCVEFDTGADYIFETGGTFTLGKNVKINRGAKLLIKPSDINF